MVNVFGWLRQRLAPAASTQQIVGGGGYTGSKFPGEWGPSMPTDLDLCELRDRSVQLWGQVSFGRGPFLRLQTNVVHTGFALEATPEAAILATHGEDELSRWSDQVETRFGLWAARGDLIDFRGGSCFADLQRRAYLESLVVGDVLIVHYKHTQKAGPKIDLISGVRIRSDMSVVRGDNRVIDGVEYSRTTGQTVAYHVAKSGGGTERFEVNGEGYISRLFTGVPMREGECRGTPLLSPIIGLIRDADRYRSAVVRKSLIGSIIAVFLRKQQGSQQGGKFGKHAQRSSTLALKDADGGEHTSKMREYMPGLVVDDLPNGVDPVAFQSNTADMDYGKFEQAITASMAWTLQIPPEILTLSFNSNYSASQAAINEFSLFLGNERARLVEALHAPHYEFWLEWEAAARGKIKAPGIASDDYALRGAWRKAMWIGSIKPSMDQRKTADAWRMMVDEGFATRAMAARATTGRRFSTIVAQLKKENEKLRDAGGAWPPTGAQPEPGSERDDDK